MTIPSEQSSKRLQPASTPSLNQLRTKALPLTTAALIWSVVVWLGNRANDYDWMWDMKVLLRAGRAVTTGDSVYSNHSGTLFTHAPFDAVIYAPLAHIPLPILSIAWNAISILALEILVWITLKRLNLRTSTIVVLLASSTLLWIDPIFKNLLLGQNNIIIVCAIVVDFTLPNKSHYKGILLGVFAGLKLTPLLLIVYLALTRRYKIALRAVLGFLATVAIGAAVLPKDSLKYWTGTAFNADRAGETFDPRAHSLLSNLERWTNSQDVFYLWAVCTCVVAAVCLASGVYLHKRNMDMSGAYACGVGTLLVSPVTWNHHYVWLIPVIIIVGVAGYRQKDWVLSTGSLFTAAVLFSHPYTWNVPVGALGEYGIREKLLTSSYGIAATICVTLLFRVKSVTMASSK